MGRHSIFSTAGFGMLNSVAAPTPAGELVVEKDQRGQPHRGKVFTAIHAHLHDVPYYAAGLCAKLMSEGYTGYIVRTSNDERSGGHSTANQRTGPLPDGRGSRNHDMDGISYIDLRARLILIFRMLKVDTIISFNPWGEWEEYPDHCVTGRAVEEACWMAGMPNDYPEHMEAGIEPHAEHERYYFYTCPGHPHGDFPVQLLHHGKRVPPLQRCLPAFPQKRTCPGQRLCDRSRYARPGNRNSRGGVPERRRCHRTVAEL